MKWNWFPAPARRRPATRLRVDTLEDRANPAPLPDISGLAAPGSVKPLLGEDVSFAFNFQNNSGTDTGYSPFFDLAVDASGPDGSTNPPDGFGTPVVNAGGLDLNPVGTITLSAGQTTYTNPFTNQSRPVPAGFGLGDKIYVYQLPFGSFTPGQTTAVSVKLPTSNRADVGSPLPLVVTPGFRDDNAVAPFAPSYGTPRASDATPELWRLKKTYLGPEDETATGPNYKRRYRLEVDIATGQPVSGLRITDDLASSMQITGAMWAYLFSGGAQGANSFSAANLGGTATTAAPDGTLVYTFGNRTGQAGTDAAFEFEFYVPRDRATGPEVLPQSAAAGTNSVLDNNTGRSDGVWNPLDTRDARNQAVSIVLPANAHTLQEHSLATQKSVIAVTTAAPNTPTSGPILPGQTLLRYTIDFQVSDYYAMNGIFLQDVLGDGQRLYLGGGLEPTLSVENPWTTAGTRGATSTAAFGANNANTIDYRRNYTVRGVSESDPTNGSEGYGATGPTTGAFTAPTAGAIDGTTRLTFRISDELIARNLSGILVGGEIADGGGPPANNNPTAAHGPAQGTITFWAVVKKEFSDDFPSGDRSVDQGDRLNNSVPLIQGTHLDPNDLADGTPTLLGTIGTDDTGTSVEVPRGLQTKTVYAINGVPIATQGIGDTVFSVQAGDRVTYKLTYTLPISRFEDLELLDIPPLPVIPVGPSTNYTFDRTFDGSFNNYEVEVAGDDTFFSTFPGFASLAPGTTLTTNATTNTLRLGFGDFDDPAARSTRISLFVTLPIGADPFVSDLFLTNQLRVNETSTNQGQQTVEDLRRFQLVTPQLRIDKGIVGYNSTGRTLGTLALGFLGFNPPGGSSTFSGGPFYNTTQADFVRNADLNYQTDAGDTVRYAIVAQNTGRGDAFNVHITDQVQAGYVVPATFAGLNLTVRRGDGSLLTQGIDYTVVSYSNVTGAFEIELVDNYTAGNLNPAGQAPDDRSGALSRGQSTPAVNAGDTPTATAVANGSNTVIVQYDLTLEDDVQPNQAIVNTARITNYSSSEPGGDLTDPLVVPGATTPSDTATNLIALPGQAKTFVGTEFNGPGNNAANQATIGEIVTYQLVLTIPEGFTPGADILDQLSDGMAFVDVTDVTVNSPDLTFGSGLSVADNGANNIATLVANTTVLGTNNKDIRFVLGDITNANLDNATAETITITYRAIVLNTNNSGRNNQATATRTNAAHVRWTNNPNVAPVVGAGEQSSKLGTKTGTPTPVTLVEPTVSTRKRVTNMTDGVGPAVTVRADAGDTIRYTIALTGSGSTAYDLDFSDLLPAALNGPTIVGVSSTGTVAWSGVGSLAAAFELSGGTVQRTPAANIDLDPTATITILVEGTWTGGTGGLTPNTADTQWTSLDGTPGNRANAGTGQPGVERIGTGGLLNGGALNDYHTRDTANVDTPPLVRKTIVATSEAATTAGLLAARGAVGEVVRYRLVTSVGEGTAFNFQIQDNLPAGLRFLNDGTARFGFVTSNGADLTSAGITDIAALAGGGIMGDQSALAALASASVTGEFDDENVFTAAAGVGTGEATIYATGADVFFRFGDLTNADRDLDTEFVVIEFNALVENVAGNQAGTVLSNDYAVLADIDANGTPEALGVLVDTDGSGTATAGDVAGVVSNPAVVTLVEPTVSINKEIIATTGSVVTYRVTVANAAGANAARAHDVRVLDALDGTDLSLVGGSVGGFTLVGGTAGAFDSSSTSGNTVDGRVAFLDPGSSVSFTYRANVLTTPAGGTTLDNTATATGTSLNGDHGTDPFFGTDGSTLGTPGTPTGERTGAGGLNDYTATDAEKLGSIGDRVWVDAMNPGVQDAGEPGIVGAPVMVRWAGPNGVFDDGDDSVINITTGADGVYTVSGLPVDSPGAFRVTVDTSAAPFTTFGLDTQTFDADGLGTANQSQRTITGGTPNPRDQDFGYRGTARLGDFVWNDRDGDENQDADEPGIPLAAVTVTWLGQDGVAGGDDVVYTTTTDATGHYAVANLPAGNYTVGVEPLTLPDNLTQTFDLDGVGSANTTATTLSLGQNRTDVDFGYQGGATVGDRVWYDVDGDGVQDVGEPGISGVTVTLRFGGDDGDLATAADNITYTTTTGADGLYLFPGIPGGDFTNTTDPNYRVTVTPAAGYPSQTFDQDGLGTANQSELRLGATETNLLQDFGYRGPVSQGLGDFVWEDVNGNGRQDTGEPGIDGISVELLDGNGTVLTTTTTAGGGAYAFPNLADSATFGPYQVRFGDTAGGITYTRTTPNSSVATGATDSDAGVADGRTGEVNVPTGTINNDVDAGLYQLVAIGDRVWFDPNNDGVQDAGEPGIVGATIRVTWLGVDGQPGGGDDINYPAITTGADGAWNLGSLPPGNFTVAVSNLPAGITAATFDLDSGTTSPDGTTLATVPSGAISNVDFGFRGTAALGDRVWYDRNGNRTQDPAETGLNGVTVRLTWPGQDGDYGTPADNYTATRVTAGDGDYLFPNLPAGGYRVDVLAGVPPTYQPTYDLDGIATPDTVTTTLTAGQTRTDVDFGYADLSSFAGFAYLDADNDGVFDAGELPLVNVQIKLTGTDINGTPVSLTTTTLPDGSYKFADLITGTYSVRETQPRSFLDGKDTAGTPALAGLVGTNDSFGSFVLPPGVNAVNYNFGELTRHTSIGGNVYFDRNNDGLQQPTERGIGGVVVRLKGTDDLGHAVNVSVTTDAFGRYSFIQMRPGTYRVVESHPSAFVDGKDRQGSLGGSRTNDRLAEIVVRPGDRGVNYNFGERGLTARALSKRLYVTLPSGFIAAATPGSGVRIVDPLLGTGDGNTP